MSRANVLALEDELPSGAYNIGTGIETDVNELYNVARALLGNGPPARYGPAKPAEQLRSSIDPARAGRILGWRPEVKLAEGLEETLRSLGTPP
jgi:UDP-glucose 4-epimerase